MITTLINYIWSKANIDTKKPGAVWIFAVCLLFGIISDLAILVLLLKLAI